MELLNNEWGIADCEKRQEIRHFYLNRIENIKMLEIGRASCREIVLRLV